jgi:hypothetical protein
MPILCCEQLPENCIPAKVRWMLFGITLWDKLRKAHNAQRRVETTFRVGRSLANVKTRLAIKFTVIPSTPRVISSNV